MSFKPIEPKRDEFRRYLEHCGIIEALTKVFSKLIDEEKRPENPLEYIRDHLGDSVLQFDNVAQLHAELEEARNEIIKLKSIASNENIEIVSVYGNENAAQEAPSFIETTSSGENVEKLSNVEHAES